MVIVSLMEPIKKHAKINALAEVKRLRSAKRCAGDLSARHAFHIASAGVKLNHIQHLIERKLVKMPFYPALMTEAFPRAHVLQLMKHV
jgi:hypothetical protein